MKICKNQECEKEIPEKRTYCSPECQRKGFSQSQKGKHWSDEKKKKLSSKLKIIHSSEEVQEKRKKTCLEKYGGNAPSCSKEIQDKMKQTCLEKYGTENAMQSKEIKEIAKQSMEEKYGGFTLQSSELKEKVRLSNLEKYGCKNPFSAEEIKEKIKQINLKRYGVENPMQSQEIQEKMKQTCIEKYGVENPMQSQEVRFKSLSKDRNMNHEELKTFFNKINSQEWWNEKKNFFEIRDELNNLLTLSQMYLYAHKFRPDWDFSGFISQPHQRILNLLDELGIDYETNDRTQITPYELDIWIPSAHLAIEVNGVYWHSEIAGGKNKNYHLNKTIECEKKGIQLLQFWDIEIENKWNIISSIIQNKLGFSKIRIGARKCIIHEVHKKHEEYFLNQNHLQGYVPSNICHGIYYQGELLSLISYRKPRFNKKVDWELLRFCNKIDYQIQGGVFKLFKKRPKGTIISYSDKRYSNGNLYKKLGFTQQESSGPNYFYTKDYINFKSRVAFQKHKLSKLIEFFDPSLTEWENMKINNYDRIWDCGNTVWIISSLEN